MDMLPVVPVLLLAVVAAWFFWPVAADAVSRPPRPDRRALKRDADRLAESLFETWHEHGKAPGLLVRQQQG
jgi:hypothetical protein